MAEPLDYASFMIRMWRDPAGERDEAEGQGTVWLGEVESVQSGRVFPFRGLEGLAELLAADMSDAAGVDE